jgi:hypothetical protein
MKSAALAMVLGCAVIAVLIQRMKPSDPFIYYPGGNSGPNRVALAKTALALTDANKLYTDLAVKDSLLPRIPSAPGIYIDVSPAAIDSPAALRRLIDEEMRGSPPPKARIAVFLVHPLFGVYKPDEKIGTDRSERTFYAGVDSAGPYCAVVLRLQSQIDSSGRHPSRLNYRTVRRGRDFYTGKSQVLGPCVFWARHGAPGPSINTWLNNGGYEFAAGPANTIPAPNYFYYGMYGARYGTGGSIAAEACRAGETEQCAAAFTNNGRRAGLTRLAAYETGLYTQYWSIGHNDEGLLAYIDQEFGGEKFEKFWKSDAAPESAFGSAFGVPLATWMQQWTQRTYGSITPSPRMSAKTILFSLLTLAFLIYVSIRFAQDRQIK